MPKETERTKEVNRLLTEIRAEEDAIPLSPWTLTLEQIMNWDKEESDWDSGKRDYSLLDVWDADTPKKLNEASLGYLYSRYLESQSRSLAIIPDYSKQTINQRNQSTKSTGHTIGGDNCFSLWRHSQEDGGPDDGKIHLVETYWLVIRTPLNDLRIFAEQYGPYLILYSGPETDGHVRNFVDSGAKDDIGPFHPIRIAQYYSNKLGRPVVFEAHITGWAAGQGALRHGVKEVSGIRKASKLITKTVRHD